MASPTRTPSGQAGPSRQQLWRAAKGRMRRALEEGFYLEAIALQESMIADRLESLLDGGDGIRMQTLGRLISAATGLLDRSTLAAIDEWRNDRNAALHQMVKHGEGFDHGWRERIAYAHLVALRGIRVIQVTDSAVRAAKRR